MVQCTQCGREFGREGMPGRVISIAGSILGDEFIESYYYCPRCQVYTVEVYIDRFLGEETASVQGPVPKAEGDGSVELIRQCPQPWDKKCRCEAHRRYFAGSLD